jgi:hypothetical protein
MKTQDVDCRCLSVHAGAERIVSGRPSSEDNGVGVHGNGHMKPPNGSHERQASENRKAGRQRRGDSGGDMTAGCEERRVGQEGQGSGGRARIGREKYKREDREGRA